MTTKPNLTVYVCKHISKHIVDVVLPSIIIESALFKNITIENSFLGKIHSELGVFVILVEPTKQDNDVHYNIYLSEIDLLDKGLVPGYEDIEDEELTETQIAAIIRAELELNEGDKYIKVPKEEIDTLFERTHISAETLIEELKNLDDQEQAAGLIHHDKALKVIRLMASDPSFTEELLKNFDDDHPVFKVPSIVNQILFNSNTIDPELVKDRKLFDDSMRIKQQDEIWKSAISNIIISNKGVLEHGEEPLQSIESLIDGVGLMPYLFSKKTSRLIGGLELSVELNSSKVVGIIYLDQEEIGILLKTKIESVDETDVNLSFYGFFHSHKQYGDGSANYEVITTEYNGKAEFVGLRIIP